MNDEDVIVLYVEDKDDIRPTWLEFIRGRYSSESKAVASYRAARKLIEGGAFRPHVAIHDASILNADGDESDSERAGNLLYRVFVRAGIPVSVLSGEDVRGREPYRSNPLQGVYLSKPVSEAKIIEAIEACIRRDEQGS